MVAIRKLPSGKYQATVRLPGGKRVTRSDRLRKVVADWGRAEEERITRGEWRDQRASRITFDEWRDRFIAARVVEPETARRDRGVVTNHLDPQWSGWRLAAISRLEVQGWVKHMQAGGVGAHAIRHAYNLLATMLGAAVDDGLIVDNPCRRIDLPATPTKLPQWFTPEQVDAICEHLPATYVVGVRLMSWCGLRWGECAGLRVGDVNFLRRRLTVVGSMPQRGGVWKEYPKTSKSRREIPVPPHVLALLAPLAAGRGPGDLLFLTERPFRGERRPWSGANWRVRWYEAVDAAGAPRFSPHALRHTAASWLVQQGVPLYDVQAQLGHESFSVTQRYSHLQPDAHGAVEAAWARMINNRATHQGRTGPSAAGPTAV